MESESVPTSSETLPPVDPESEVQIVGPRGRHVRIVELVAPQAGAESLFACRDAAGRDLGVAGLRRGSVSGSFLHLIDRGA